MDLKPLELSTDDHPSAVPLAPRGPPAPDPRARASPVRILLAHRPGIYSEGLAGLLAAEPSVEPLPQVTDGEAAWAAIRARAPDLALLDLALTKASGIEVVRRVQAAGLATRCLMLATHPDPGLASQALRARAAGCFHKDNGFDELMLALRSIHAGEVYLSPSIAAGLGVLRDAGQDGVSLTSREREVLRLVAAGKRSKTIAWTLDISPHTVDTHRRRLMSKLGLRSTAEVVRYALGSGLLD